MSSNWRTKQIKEKIFFQGTDGMQSSIKGKIETLETLKKSKPSNTLF